MKPSGLPSLLFLSSAVVATHLTATCRDLQYVVNDYTFQGEAIYSTPSHLAVTQASADFNLNLPFLNGDTVHCAAPQINAEYPVYSYGDTWYPCAVTDGGVQACGAAWKVDLTGELDLLAVGKRYGPLCNRGAYIFAGCRLRRKARPTLSLQAVAATAW